MTNLVDRLRTVRIGPYADDREAVGDLLHEAADEIERLRVKADQWDALIRDIGAPLCSYPCLRDDFADWLMKRAADEPPAVQVEPTGGPVYQRGVVTRVPVDEPQTCVHQWIAELRRVGHCQWCGIEMPKEPL